MAEKESFLENKPAIGGIERSLDNRKPLEEELKEMEQQIDKGANPERVRQEIKSKKVCALLSPDYFDSYLIHDRIKEQIFEDSKTEGQRNDAVEEKGFDHKYLEGKGKAISETGKRILNEFASLEEKNELRRARNLAFSGGKTSKDVNKRVEHSSLSVGLAAELSRQMRKIVSAYGEGDPKKVREILAQDDFELTMDDVKRFVDMHKPDQAHGANMKAIIEQIESPEKRRQYLAAIKMLNSELRLEK